MSWRKLFIRTFLLATIAGAVLWAALHRDQLDPANLDAWLSGLGIWAPLSYAALYAAGTVVFLPGSLFALAGGALFGPVWGSVLNLFGATAGAGVAFLVARYLAGDWVAQRAAGRLKQLMSGVESEGWRFVAFVRLVPLFPFNLTNYAFGLTRIKFLPYMLTSLISMAPGAVAYTWLGYAGREAVAGDASAIRYGLLALAILAAIAFLPRVIGRLRAPDKFRWIATDDLAKRLAGGDVTIIDVRGPGEFTGPLGHIGTALNLPVEELSNRLMEISTLKDKTVIVACRTEKRSVAAAALLREAGFRHLHVLRGGMEQWNSRGLPVQGRVRMKGVRAA